MKNLIKIFLFIMIFSGYVFPQWSNNPSLNTEIFTGYTNFNPQAISDGTGGVIVIWEADYGLYANRISPLGYKLWNSDGVLITNLNVSNPQIICDGSGGAFISWVDNRYYNSDIYLQRIDNNGNILWQGDGIAVCTNEYEQDLPVMCSDNSGGVYIAWQDSRNANLDIYAQRVNSTGAVQWTADGIPVYSDTYDQVSPQIASDGSGNAIIVWTDSRNFLSTLDIYAQKIDLAGSSLWAADGESVCSASDYQSNAKIVNSGTDEVIVAWEDERGSDKDIYAQRIITNNSYLYNYWSYDGEIVCSASSDQYNIQLLSNSTGEAIISWTDERNGDRDIFAQRINSTGQIGWINNGEAICSEVNDQFDQEIISDGYSGAIITWSDRRTSIAASDIYAQRIDTDGYVKWTINGVVLANATNEQLEPSVVMLNPNNFFVAFTDKRTGSGIYCQKFLIDGSLPPAVPESVDGVISANEYGGSQGSYSAGDGITWYMKMDESYIYVGISGYTNASDAVVIYLSNSRISPVNIIDNSYGSVIGANYDGVTPNLPFRSTYFVFVKPGYDDYKYFDGAGGWGPSTINGIIKSYNASNQVIEFIIPWSSLPDIEYTPRYGMNWLGFLSYAGGGGGTFARVPLENPSGTNPDMGWYFDTGYASFGGIIDFPFRNKCYTHVGNDILNFGAISVWDFTLNSPGKQIIRTSGDWNIGGVLLVNNGTLAFDSNNPVNVQTLEHRAGEIRFSSGSFDAPLNVSRIYRENLAGPLFMDAGQTTTFIGNLTAFWDQGSEIIQLQQVMLNCDKLDLYSDMTINQSLELNSGIIQTNGYNLILKPHVNLIGPGYIYGSLVQYIPPSAPKALGKVDGTNNLLVNFPVGTANGPSPVSVDFGSVTAGGTLTVQAFESVHPNSVVPNESMKRYWKITKDNDLVFTNANLTFNYLASDFNTMFTELDDEANMIVGKYSEGSWTFPTVVSRSMLGDGGSLTISGVTSFSDFTMAKSESALPVELTLFTASVRNNSVLLNWTTATELNNYGFEIERTVHTSMALPLSVTKWETIGFIAGSGNSNSPKEYSFIDGSLIGGSKFKYRLKQIDNDGTFSYSDEINVEVVPTKFELSQNYPNPFNPSTKIRFTIPASSLNPFSKGEGTFVSLKVYDVLGNEVATLVNEEKPAGVYEVTFDAAQLSSGIYFYRLTAGSFTETKKMTILK